MNNSANYQDDSAIGEEKQIKANKQHPEEE